MASQGKNKTNFKTYEASTRLLAAVIATTNVKLDYAELAKYIGGTATKDAVDHRLRPIKRLAKMQVACVKKGEDPGELPVDKGEIQKLFGESTPSGIEWQFRDIKNLAKAQQAAVKNGESPAKVTVPSTPGRGRGAGARTPGSRATAKTPGTTTPSTRGRKRKLPDTLAPLDSDEDKGNADNNDSDCTVVDTPSKRLTKNPKTKAALASAKKENGNMTMPTATAATPTTTPAATPGTRTSIFGGDGSVPDIMPSTEAFDNGIGSNTSYGTRLFASATTRPARVNPEPATESNPFLSAATAGDFEDELEDGEF